MKEIKDMTAYEIICDMALTVNDMEIHVDIYSDHGYNRRSVFGLFAGCGVAVRADI